MPIKNLMRYDPEISEINNEGDVIVLLRDVRRRIRQSFPDSDFSHGSWQETVEAVERGNYEFRENHLDLGKARALVSRYRYFSTKGCQSCQHTMSVKPCEDETWTYCGLSESAESVDSDKSSWSPRVQQHAEEGCEHREAVFRPLEEVLEEVGTKGF